MIEENKLETMATQKISSKEEIIIQEPHSNKNQI
jgi:hypothetical protein